MIVKLVIKPKDEKYLKIIKQAVIVIRVDFENVTQKEIDSVINGIKETFVSDENVQVNYLDITQ